MTDSITSQNIDLSSWITLYFNVSHSTTQNKCKCFKWQPEGRRFLQWQEILLFFSKAFRLALRPTDPPLQHEPRGKSTRSYRLPLFSNECWGQELAELYLYSPLTTRVFMAGTEITLRLTLPWRIESTWTTWKLQSPFLRCSSCKCDASL